MGIDISRTASQGFKELAWDVFFASRGRGISLEAHFPFLGQDKAEYVTVTLQGETVAGLALVPVTRRGTACVAGLVGLVCVHPGHRGVGHSTAVLRAAIAHARALQLDDLVLWTGKPGVYQTLGFDVHDSAVFGTVTAGAAHPAGRTGALRCAWPGPGEGRGLPPFAIGAHEWKSPLAAIVVLEDPAGPILAEWSGLDEHALAIIDEVMPDKWRINALAGDRLLGLLDDGTRELDLRPANLQMIMNLRQRAGEADPYRLRMLDRI